MAEHFLYLTTTGRTTGLPRTIEIWFVDHDGRYYVVSEAREQSNWVKNIQREPRATFCVGSRADRNAGRPTCAATARIVRPETDPALASAVGALMDAKYGWSDGLIVELSPAWSADHA